MPGTLKKLPNFRDLFQVFDKTRQQNVFLTINLEFVAKNFVLISKLLLKIANCLAMFWKAIQITNSKLAILLIF